MEVEDFAEEICPGVVAEGVSFFEIRLLVRGWDAFEAEADGAFVFAGSFLLEVEDITEEVELPCFVGYFVGLVLA
jgi:hypothetical protein